VLRQRKDMDETVEALNKERQLIECTMEELIRINSADLNLDILASQSKEEVDDSLRQRMHYSMIELVKERNGSLAALLAPNGMKNYFREQSELL
jgi:hypothetical protein